MTLPRRLGQAVLVSVAGLLLLAPPSGAAGEIGVLDAGTPLAARLALHGVPGFTAVGVQHPVAVQALDAQGNTDPAYQGVVRFAATPAGAVLPGPHQFTLEDRGVHAFVPGISFGAPGTYAVSVSDTASTVIGTRSVEVLGPGRLEIVGDFNVRAAVGVPYVYNGAGSVTVANTTGQAPTFSECGVPVGFRIDSHGAVRWTPDVPGTFSVCLVAAAVGFPSAQVLYQVAVEPPPSAGPPVASFQVLPDRGGPGTAALHDPAGTVVPTGWRFMRWRFGDGTAPSAEEIPVHRYWLPGGYRPHLTVWDELGRSARADRPMKVLEGPLVPPEVRVLSHGGFRGKAPFTTELEAQVIQGSAEAPLVRWNLGDGRVAFGSRVSVTYAAGRFWPSAVAVDRNGLTGRDKVELVVLQDTLEPPECVAVADPPAINLAAGSPGSTRLRVVHGPGSSPMVTVDWQVDGTLFPGVPQLSRSYDRPGWHHAVVVVKDGNLLKCVDDVWVAALLPQGSAVGVPPLVVDQPGRTGICGRSLAGPPLAAVGTGPVQWTAEGEPDGLSIDEQGRISWSPPSGFEGEVAFDAVATTDWGQDRARVTLTVSCPPELSFETTPCGCETGGGALPGLLLLLAADLARRRSRRPAAPRPGR